VTPRAKKLPCRERVPALWYPCGELYELPRRSPKFGMSLDRAGRVFEHPSFRERYDVADRIGSGSFAQVYRAVQRTTGQAAHLGMAVAHERLG